VVLVGSPAAGLRGERGIYLAELSQVRAAC
jgi:hypothetical protein